MTNEPERCRAWMRLPLAGSGLHAVTIAVLLLFAPAVTAQFFSGWGQAVPVDGGMDVINSEWSEGRID